MSKAKINIDEMILEEVVKKVLNESEKQQKERAKKKRDRRLRNTDLLLRNYDNLITHIDYAVEDEKKLEEEDPEEVLDEIEEEIDLDNDDEYEGIYINAIKRTRTRTKIIVKHIEVAIEFYKQKVKISNNYNDKRRYEVIYKYYFEKKKIPVIAEELGCSDKTISRDKKRAVEELSVLFFGIDGMKFSL
ncbi:helix-turn-helix domain-containing protein [Clostridium sp. YIM B02506]|uniref:helix-turn-helix domain-containing protein n=1 Tax=Clostridium sp. YIM B02506 TaxID=2910680 RepID=UPI001EEDD7C3|nr:helix-turn-helix domain-containing protein [Clostridium sp. YIM B02506]